MLAAGIGNIHGKYPANWAGLSFETLDAIQQLTGDMPLVLHGGTGIPDDMIKKAISLGVAKINVNTECQLSLQQQQENISRLARIWKARALILENFSYLEQKQSRQR